jgi:3-methyl-2-oxobutanoate hydroxymethyltransferase
MSETPRERTKITVPALRAMKRAGERITALTAYDASFARLLDASGVDVLLVGDSLGMVIQGGENTLAVTVEDVIYHTRAVVRGSRRAHVVADLPFMSYQVSLEEGLRSAGRLIKEGGAEAVKLEGGRRHADLVQRLTEIGIPVMGHIGLTPQSVHAMGGYRVQGRGEEAAQALLEDALALEAAGVYSLVLEGIPRELAAEITRRISVPTIGIGAGPECDGQVLVIYDLLGMDDSFAPRFLKRYDSLAERIRDAVARYGAEVRGGVFPAAEHSFSAGKRGQAAPPRLASRRSGRGQQPALSSLPAKSSTAEGEPIPLYPGGGKRRRGGRG